MSDGTWGTFQGIALRACTYRNGRGYTPGGAEMLMLARDFPAGFDFRTPVPGQLATAVPAEESSTVTQARGGDAGPIGPPPLPRALSYEGWLVMSETVDGKTWAHPPIRLFVVRVESVRLSEEGGVAVIRVTAWDERYHWEHGWLRRWSYNRRRADGTISLDTVNPDGSLVTQRQIADAVTAALFRKPKLSQAPAEWSTKTPAMDFGPNPAAVTALARLVRESDLEDPCLRLDGSVALHRAGDGLVGYAEGGVGPNAKPFPAGMLLWKNGSGQGLAVEFGYPEDVVVVAGGPRIASVAIDDLEPVVVIEDVVFVLNDANVRFLTSSGGKNPAAGRDLAWLRKFVFAPAEWAGDPLIPEPLLEVFRTQAFRLWRVPGVEVERAVDDGAARPVAGARLRVPGPNAHLMPMLARAESVASKRLPIIVETYTFAMRRRKLAGSGATARQQAALLELQRLREEIATRARTAGNPNPFNPRPGGPSEQFKRGLGVLAGPLEQQVPPGSMLSGEAATQMGKAGVSVSDLEDFVRTARTVDRIGEQASPGLAKLYEDALKERYKAEDAAAGNTTNTTLYELAKAFLDAEKKAEADGSLFDTTAEAFKALALDQVWSKQVVEAMEKLRAEREATRVRGGAEGENDTQTFFVNVARTIDAGARIFDEDRGIFETSGLAGHLVNPDVHDLGHPDAQLMLCPVRAIFGTHVRPRVDVPPGKLVRPRTGEGSQSEEIVTDCPGGQTHVPVALTDETSYFVAGFRRGAGGAAISVDPATLAADQALVVQRPDLCELVGLDDSTNAGELTRQAAEVATELFRRPEAVRAATATIARAWPVQPDGIVEEVTIQMRQSDGIPCGYETVLTVGSGAQAKPTGATQVRTGAGAAQLQAWQAQQAAARREGAMP